MTTIVQVEFRESLLSIREEILQSLGHPVISALVIAGWRKDVGSKLDLRAFTISKSMPVCAFSCPSVRKIVIRKKV